MIWGIIIFIILMNIFSSEPGYIIGTLLIGFLLWIWFGTGYSVEDGLINIRFGPFRSKVSIKEIKTISKTRNPFSAPALSTNRLEILYGKYDMLNISPKNENDFIKLLLSENPHIKIDIPSNHN